MKSQFVRLVIIILIPIAINAQESQLRVDRKNDFYGFVNQSGEVIIKHKYSSAENFSEGFALVENHLKFGYINKKGKVVIMLKYSDAGTFSEGMAYISEYGKYGYIDTSGKCVIKQMFDSADDFLGNFALVRMYNPDTSLYGTGSFITGIIDKKGNLVTNSWYSKIFRIDTDSFELSIKQTNYRLSKNGKLQKSDDQEKRDSLNKNPSVLKAVPPEFVGGIKSMTEFIFSNLKYPKSAKVFGIKGRVFVIFYVDEKGKIIQAHAANGTYPVLNKEALRIVKSMPNWNPGRIDGNPVTVKFTIPFNFVLDE